MAKRRADDGQVDTDTDRYPDLKGVVASILDDPNLPQGPVERLEVTCLASGEATYRVWAARAEDPEGGYIPPSINR
jgi:hypothetical protein